MGKLFDRLAAFANLLEAARLASRGKRFRPNVAAFSLSLEEELHALRAELCARTYRPGLYRTGVESLGSGLDFDKWERHSRDLLSEKEHARRTVMNNAG